MGKVWDKFVTVFEDEIHSEGRDDLHKCIELYLQENAPIVESTREKKP